jgi:hypothetical protein
MRRKGNFFASQYNLQMRFFKEKKNRVYVSKHKEHILEHFLSNSNLKRKVNPAFG